MFRPLLLTQFIFLASGFWAQDYLFKKDNSKVAVKVMEIGINDIRYKPFDHLNGPVYVIDKKEVSLILFENGMHEVIETKGKDAQAGSNKDIGLETYPKKESPNYFRYTNSIAFNTLGLINNEFSFLYQREFYKRHFNVIVPFSFGISAPNFTKYLYYNNSRNFNINKKIVEIGLGINYCGGNKGPVNYYIGPVLKYILYEASQNFSTSFFSSSMPQQVVIQNFNVHTVSASVTNGIVIRSQSRFMMNIFGSMGYRYAQIASPLVDPFTQKEVDLNFKEIQFYFWAGVAIGYSF